jgi:hypothetical protein
MIIVFPRNFISFSLEGADLVYSTWIPIQSILRTVPWDFYLFIVVFINQYTLRSLLHILKYFGFWLILVHVYKFISWESTTKMYITSQSVLGYQGVDLKFSKACHKFYWGDSQNNGLWIFFLSFFSQLFNDLCFMLEKISSLWEIIIKVIWWKKQNEKKSHDTDH